MAWKEHPEFAMAGREKLNIVLLCQSLATGGLEQMVVNLAAGLDRERYQRTIGCIERREDLVEQAQSQGVEVFFLDKGPGVKPGAVWTLSRILRKRKTDILHTHNAGSLLYGVPAGKLAGVPSIVHTEHGRLIGETERVRANRGERWLSRWANEVAAVSEPTREVYSRITGIPLGRIKVVGNGVDIKRYQKPADARLREQLGIRAGDYVLGIVARLSPEKDHALLFRAFDKVLATVKNLRLLVIGDGPERANLEKLAEQLRIDHKVAFAGFRKDIPDLLALLDLFVLCSRTEGMPLTLLEAMAAGKAIVCSSVGGIPGILESGVNGLLIPPEDEARLATALQSLIQDRSLAMRFGKQARRDAEQKYSIEKMVGDYEALYLKHLKKR